MKSIKFTESNDALVGVVVTFLLIGLIVSVISIIQTVYIPKMMEQTEAEHMDEVADQFAQLKSAIDMQGVIGLNQRAFTSISTISTSITLGSKELPFFMTARAYGSLIILPEDSFRIVIADIHSPEAYHFASETIQYSSSNAYFLDQTYIYEAGAVILSQNQGDNKGNIMLMKPSFSVKLEDTVNINFTAFKIARVGGKGSISGYGTYPIQTEYSNESYKSLDNVTSITIYTKYQNAWSFFVDKMLLNSGLNHSNFNILNITNGVSIQFDEVPNPLPVTLRLYEIRIYTQVAPGWIETK